MNTCQHEFFGIGGGLLSCWKCGVETENPNMNENVESAMRKSSAIRERFTFSDVFADEMREESENRPMFCLACGATHRHGHICKHCDSDAQDEL